VLQVKLSGLFVRTQHKVLLRSASLIAVLDLSDELLHTRFERIFLAASSHEYRAFQVLIPLSRNRRDVLHGP